MFLPLFPLELVVFPDQELPLHIFEPRYKQLIGECREQGMTFGIPTVHDNRLAEYGTEVYLVKILRTYDSGEMDVLTRGRQAFRIKTYVGDVPDKLYAGGEILPIANDPSTDESLRKRVLELFERLHKILHAPVRMELATVENLSFKLAHGVGYTLDQKIELLSKPREDDRLEMTRAHLEWIIPRVERGGKVRAKILGNGHVREFPKTE